MYDPRSGVLGLFVVMVDAFTHEHRFTGEIRVIGAGGGTCGDKRQPVAVVRSDSRHHDLRPRGHRIERRGLRGIRRDERPGLRRLPQRLPHRLQLVLRTACKRNACVAAGAGQVLRGQLSDEPGRAVHDDVELTVAHACGTHGVRRYPSVSGGSMSSPSTCRPRNAMTTWYQILACCGESTQWFSEGK